ncbi:unnamed protein product [Orchesella dallaii]|uniref:Uncharacterized protein n=1 Tax=Orchesella dallaii TaxID=48710 RepID=A0ABP1QIN3_9HEXA
MVTCLQAESHICALSQLATALPQRQVQLGAGGPRPVSYGGAAVSPTSFGPNYSQQLSFGANSAPQIAQTQTPSPSASPQIRARGPSPYQSPQPILISQGNPSASPATPAGFATFPGGSPFGGAGSRQILTLRSPHNQQQEEDEYEYEDEDEPQIQSRPTPRPVQATRAPIRVAQPTPGSSHLGAGPGRFVSQVQPQRQSQRQPIPQQQFPQAAQPQQPQRGNPQSAPRPNNGFGLDGKRSRLTTPPPIQTVNRYMKQNDDGSITWGYENEDGTFKEETLGADCVVRGKYGYIDPEGNKREYEYQTGNPCDPNKKNQEEEEEEEIPDGPSRPQQLAGVLNARPRPVQRRPNQGGQHQQQQYQAQPQYQIS